MCIWMLKYEIKEKSKDQYTLIYFILKDISNSSIIDLSNIILDSPCCHIRGIK
jgi:hypothetical protein